MSLQLAPSQGGRELRIDPLAAGDTGPVQAVFDGLSARSRFLRFHTGLPRLTQAMLRRLSAVREGQHHAFVATICDQPVGMVRWIRLDDDPTTADLAIEVVDAAQRQGVGRALISTAARSAAAAEVRWFVTDVSGDNYPLRSWLAKSGLRPDTAELSRFRIPVVAAARAARSAA